MLPYSHVPGTAPWPLRFWCAISLWASEGGWGWGVEFPFRRIALPGATRPTRSGASFILSAPRRNFSRPDKWAPSQNRELYVWSPETCAEPQCVNSRIGLCGLHLRSALGFPNRMWFQRSSHQDDPEICLRDLLLCLGTSFGQAFLGWQPLTSVRWISTSGLVSWVKKLRGVGSKCSSHRVCEPI